jgi:APA family basic amino acid/polyamine antiporter
VVGPVAIAGCLYLFFSLPSRTQLYFLVWNVIGLVAYLAYGRRKAELGKSDAPR